MYQFTRQQITKLNEKSQNDNKTLPKINDFFVLYWKIENFTIKPYPTYYFVRLRLGFDVPEQIAPVRRWLWRIYLNVNVVSMCHNEWRHEGKFIGVISIQYAYMRVNKSSSRAVIIIKVMPKLVKKVTNQSSRQVSSPSVDQN